jgi:hypothetical protein
VKTLDKQAREAAAETERVASQCIDLWQKVPEEYKNTDDGRRMYGYSIQAGMYADRALNALVAVGRVTQKKTLRVIEKCRDNARSAYNAMIAIGDMAND